MDSFRFLCKSCNEEYKVTVEGRTMSLLHNKKVLKLLLNNISFCNNTLSKKTVYELYNKGYVQCTKSLNKVFNNYDNEWVLPVSNLVTVSDKFYGKKLSELSERLDTLNTTQMFTCPSCHNLFSFDSAAINQFSCNTCFKSLTETDSCSEKEKLLAEMDIARKSASLAPNRWL